MKTTARTKRLLLGIAAAGSLMSVAPAMGAGTGAVQQSLSDVATQLSASAAAVPQEANHPLSQSPVQRGARG